MEFQEIEVFIESDGRVRLEVRGVAGESCLELTHELEASLGGQIEHREMTAEAYQQPAAAAKQLRQQQGGA